MCNALGIVNFEGPNINVKGLEDYRALGATSFLGRYRLVDFPISNMSNSGINHIKVLMKGNPRSLIEHLGSGRHYNINSKRGKLHMLPARSMDSDDIYNTDVKAFELNMHTIEDVNMDYVIIAPVHFVYRQNFDQFLDQHIASGADISILYQKVEDPRHTCLTCDVLDINDGKVNGITKNQGNTDKNTISLETYVLKKETFMHLVKKAREISSLYWFRDIVGEMCRLLDVRAIEHEGFVACINDFKHYYDANIQLLDYQKLSDLFIIDWPIYTRTNDSCPTKYYPETEVVNSMVSNGCVVEGTIRNSIIGRGCVIKKGAVVENSIIFPQVVIGEGVHVSNVVVDKKSKVINCKEVAGTSENPAYVQRNETV